jgi:ribosomal protein S12 methylthiotransferase accessory factor
MVPTPLAALDEPAGVSLEACVERLAAGGIRVAIADVTAPDVATGPLRVARALGTDMQPIDFGYKFRRLANPRIQTLLTTGLNPYPHPLA